MGPKKRHDKKTNPFNIIAQCRRYNIPLWQCPNFLIIPIGVLNVLTILGTYFIATKYTEPEAVVLIVILIEFFFMIISYLIVQGFEKLAESNRLKSEFVSIASHQLRTPLTGIKWAINLMSSEKMEGLDSEQKERIETIKENNQRMINLINDLLNVSRIEQNRLGLKPKKIKLQNLIEKIIKEYKVIAEAGNVKILTEVPEDLPSIYADPEGVSMALNNLIDNAIRYSKKDGTVKIKCTKEKKYLKCQVRDQGVGIPKEDRKKIFQKFFRSQNVMKYKTEGTGLGLFIAKSVIENMGGKMDFESKEGEGSTFWFKLPLKNKNKTSTED